MDEIKKNKKEDLCFCDIGKLVDLYRASLEWAATADERARRNVAGQLAGMDFLAETNKRIEAEKLDLVKKNDELAKTVMAQNEQIKKLEADLSAITYEVGEADRLRKKCTTLTQEKAELVARHNNEISKLQNENYMKILEILKASK